MNDIIKVNNIKNKDCNCNKPLPTPCGCLLTIPDIYFKIKNFFSELKTEWQKDEARKNLGITDIIRIEQTKLGKGSGAENIWQIVTEKNGNQEVHELKIYNGDLGESPKVKIGKVESSKRAYVNNSGTNTDVILNFGLPEGKSAYDLAVLNGFNGTLDEWLNSLKGERGDKGDLGDPGKDGTSGKLIVNVSLVDYGKFTKEFLDNLVTANMYIWQIELDTGEKYNIWIPEGINQDVPVGTPTFLYKKVTFQTLPSSSDLISKLSLLQEEVNIDRYTGKAVQDLTTTSNGWSRFSPIIRNPGLDFIYLASSVITSELVGPWSVTQLTGSLGIQGPEGPQGPAGDAGSEGLGLIGPVIRMRGTWLEDATPCYKNESNLQQVGNELRFIDVVFYNDHYWMVSPSHVGCATDRPGTSSLWVQATEFDFAYINTLIANYLSAYTIDAEEIRIHDKEENNGVTTKDTIVAGMTSGKPHNNTEQNNSGTGDDAIRIWAGSNINVLGATEGHKYDLNLESAKFKVRQNGKLEASDADVEGTILANILRLGKHVNADGSFLAPESGNSFTLPKLKNGKVLMFYLLTSRMSNDEITVYAYGEENGEHDKIKEADATDVADSFIAKREKLYLLFGIDTTWYVIEQNMKAELDTQEFNVKLATASQANCLYCLNRSINNGDAILEQYNPTWNIGIPEFTLTNGEPNPTLFTFPSEKTYYIYGTYTRKRNDNNLNQLYIKCIGKIEFIFRHCDSIVLLANNTDYYEMKGQESSGVYTYILADADTQQNKSFTVTIRTNDNDLPQNIDSELLMSISEDNTYDDNFEHPISTNESMSLSTECITNLCVSAITYSKVATSDIDRLIKFTNANN